MELYRQNKLDKTIGYVKLEILKDLKRVVALKMCSSSFGTIIIGRMIFIKNTEKQIIKRCPGIVLEAKEKV